MNTQLTNQIIAASVISIATVSISIIAIKGIEDIRTRRNVRKASELYIEGQELYIDTMKRFDKLITDAEFNNIINENYI